MYAGKGPILVQMWFPETMESKLHHDTQLVPHQDITAMREIGEKNHPGDLFKSGLVDNYVSVGSVSIYQQCPITKGPPLNMLGAKAMSKTAN